MPSAALPPLFLEDNAEFITALAVPRLASVCRDVGTLTASTVEFYLQCTGENALESFANATLMSVASLNATMDAYTR